jgi:phage RecT family recombinase
MADNQLQITPKFFQPIEQKMQDAGFDVNRVKKEISFALQTINKSAQLQKCSGESVLQAVVNIANVGLTLNPAAKEAYLIPRWSSISKGMEASLEPSYVGMVKLLTDTGSVKAMVCQLVYEGDTFEVDLANNLNPVTHKPNLLQKRETIIGVYALATLSDNTRQVEWMTIFDIHEIRDRSETYKAFKAGKIQACTWVSDFGEMARKTVIKRIYKYLPRSEKAAVLDRAIELDNTDYTASDSQISMIENLLRSSTMDERQVSWLEMELPTMGAKRASEVIEMLKNNQPNERTRIRNGETLSASETSRAVNHAVDHQ